MTTNEHKQLAKVLWDYHRVDSKLEKADVIIGLGSYDIEVARYCSQLYFDGFAPVVLFTGKEGNWTAGKITKTEARIFADEARSLGVPEEGIFLEEEATNIGANLENSKVLLDSRGLQAKKIILVTKPNTTRRALATSDIKFPEAQVMTSSPDINFSDFPRPVRTYDELVNEMVGDIQRIKIYGEKGWQSVQEVPREVWDAYNSLTSLGYTDHLIK